MSPEQPINVIGEGWEHGYLMKGNVEHPSIAFVSTYPPTSCGLATFTAALRGAIADGRGSNHGLGVVRLVDNQLHESRPEVVYEHVNGDRSSLRGAIETLNSFDGVVMQHEYGIFGGRDGEEIVDLLADIDVPAVVTLHTVLSQPTPSQRSILEKVVALAERAIVMSDAASRRIVEEYEVDSSKIRVVPHGASGKLGGPPLEHGLRPVVLTWGLIGPGKGLETAIDAFVGLRDLRPLPRYVILGETHPKVRASHGDAYLESLVARVRDRELDDVVEFGCRYLDNDALTIAIRRADLVVLPYESTEQVTSGVLVEAIAAGKPVVATPFPHAVELLGTGAGVVIPHGDSVALTAALRMVLSDPSLAHRMAAEARLIGSNLYWPAIARRYDRMMTKLAAQHRAALTPAAVTRSTEDSHAFARVS